MVIILTARALNLVIAPDLPWQDELQSGRDK